MWWQKRTHDLAHFHAVLHCVLPAVAATGNFSRVYLISDASYRNIPLLLILVSVPTRRDWVQYLNLSVIWSHSFPSSSSPCSEVFSGFHEWILISERGVLEFFGDARNKAIFLISPLTSYGNDLNDLGTTNDCIVLLCIAGDLPVSLRPSLLLLGLLHLSWIHRLAMSSL